MDYFEGMANFAQYADCHRFRAEIDCQFFNDTDTQAVYTNPEIQLWGVEGVRLCIAQPRLLTSGKSGSWNAAESIVVPKHGIVFVRFELMFSCDIQEALDAIQKYYAGAVFLLKVLALDRRNS